MDQKCWEIFRAFPVFHPGHSKRRSIRRLVYWSTCAPCLPLEAVTLPVHSTLQAVQFFRFGRVGCLTLKNQFFWSWRMTTILNESYAFLCAPVSQNLPDT